PPGLAFVPMSAHRDNKSSLTYRVRLSKLPSQSPPMPHGSLSSTVAPVNNTASTASNSITTSASVNSSISLPAIALQSAQSLSQPVSSQQQLQQSHQVQF